MTPAGGPLGAMPSATRLGWREPDCDERGIFEKWRRPWNGPRSRGYGARSGYDVRTRRLRGGPECEYASNIDRLCSEHVTTIQVVATPIGVQSRRRFTVNLFVSKRCALPSARDIYRSDCSMRQPVFQRRSQLRQRRRYQLGC